MASPRRQNPTYAAWAAAKQRCTNPRNPSYLNYGGRGIVMCDKWLGSYENFVADLGEKPTGAYLDRIDADGNYEPGNCRWVSSFVNAQNIRNTRKFWMYVHESFLARLDAWKTEQSFRLSSRADAYRRIADLALSLWDSVPIILLADGEDRAGFIRTAIQREIARRRG